MLADPARTAYLAVALGTEMAVTEALEVQEGLTRQLGRSLDAVIVNGLMPRRFSSAEIARISKLAAVAPPPRDRSGPERGTGTPTRPR